MWNNMNLIKCKVFFYYFVTESGLGYFIKKNNNFCSTVLYERRNKKKHETKQKCNKILIDKVELRHSSCLRLRILMFVFDLRHRSWVEFFLLINLCIQRSSHHHIKLIVFLLLNLNSTFFFVRKVIKVRSFYFRLKTILFFGSLCVYFNFSTWCWINYISFLFVWL